MPSDNRSGCHWRPHLALARSPYCRCSLPLSMLREARASLRGRREVASRWGAKAGRCNLYRALDSARRAACRRLCAVVRTSSPRDIARRRQTLGDLLCVYMAADATISSRLQWNSLSPAHMRCMITASLRATATVARRKPRRLAIAVPQAFSADHRVTRVSRECAAKNSASRASRSPLLLIAPLRSISPEAYLRGVKPRYGPTSRDRAKRRIVDRGCESQRSHCTDTWHGQ